LLWTVQFASRKTIDWPATGDLSISDAPEVLKHANASALRWMTCSNRDGTLETQKKSSKDQGVAFTIRLLFHDQRKSKFHDFFIRSESGLIVVVDGTSASAASE